MAGDVLMLEDVPMISQTCLCANVQRAARAVSRRFDEAFRPLNLTNWQYTLLVALFRAEAPTINTVAEDLATDRTTITANLKPLERRGLVSIAPDRDDRRIRRLVLTQAGLTLLREAYVIWRQIQHALEGDLSVQDMDRLMADLRALKDL